MKVPLNIIVLFILTGSVSSCKNDIKKNEKPATQSKPVKESDLNTITLTPKAVERLGIKTFTVADQYVGNSRIFSGEIIAVPGKIATITTPVAGTLITSIPLRAGEKIFKGQQLFKILILPSEKDLISVQADIEQKETQSRVARQKLERTSRLYEEKAGSLKAKQEAESELAAVEAQLKVARNRRDLLKGNSASRLTSRMSTLNVQSPFSGVISKVYSSSSQVLAQAASVIDIVSLDKLWVRVPIYAGDETSIDVSSPAIIRGLSEFGASGAPSFKAQPVTGPPTSDPIASSVDFYYEFDNAGTFRPGQKISVTIPYKGKTSGLAIPLASVLYDIYGNTWVYEAVDSVTFIRRRVELKSVREKIAVLNQGLASGTKVVTDGAAELFGTEFGGGK